jgi:FixJ family two-component response regulator
MTGLLNKQIGGELGTSETTIKIHRHQVMERWEPAPLLVRMADRLGIPTPKY